MAVDVKQIDALLPQTQCGECGFAGCLPYAEALASGQATINLCPPGGLSTLKALGTLLAKNPQPYLTEVVDKTRLPSIAKVREADCIGCTKCIQACPVDAIIGSAKQMHAVITLDCTGCGLCVPACPVDCIDMLEIPQPSYDKDRARQRYHARQTRLLKQAHEQQQLYREKSKLAVDAADKLAKQDYIQQALQRVMVSRKEKGDGC